MNTSLLIGLAIGGIVVAVFFKAHQVVKATAETIRPRFVNPPRAILADCETCGRTIQNQYGRCSSCGSSAIWTLGVAVPEPSDAQVGATLARVAFLADVKARAVARNEQARGVVGGVH